MTNIVDIKENKNNIVIKNQELIHNARYKLTALSLKIVAMLISMINKDDSEFKQYIIRIKDFKELIGSNSKDTYKYTHDIISELLGNPIKIENEQFNWVSYGKHIKGEGIVTFEIHRELKPYLLEIKKNFLKYNVVNILPIRSPYIIRLYEMCKDKFEEGMRYKKVKNIKYELKISEMRKLFCIPPSYQYSSGIKARILDKAIKQFKEKTDINISYEEIKVGRKYDSVIIYISENNRGSNDFLRTEKAFISYMRERYMNVDILKSIDKNTKKELIISISPDGHIYSKLGQEFDAKRSKEMWTTLYQMAKDNKLDILKLVPSSLPKRKLKKQTSTIELVEEALPTIEPLDEALPTIEPLASQERKRERKEQSSGFKTGGNLFNFDSE